MGIDRIDISRGAGSSLFIGPGALGVMPSRGDLHRNKLVLRHSMGDGAKLFTTRGIVDAFPAARRADVPGQDEIMELLQGLFRRLPSLTPDDRSLAFQLLESAEAYGGKPVQTGLMKNLECGRLYFVTAENCRAMVYAALNGSGKQVDFKVWAPDETLVATHERVVAILGSVAENRSGMENDVDVADARAVFDRLKSVRGSHLPKGLTDMMKILQDPKTSELIRIRRGAGLSRGG